MTEEGPGGIYLADFKVPRQIEFIKEIPRNTAGKALKYQLRKMEKSKTQKGDLRAVIHPTSLFVG
jgi:acyl-coenzyme A synthetase/AMP-(fatty) acid ligase